MRNRIFFIALIIVLAGFSIWAVLPNNPGIHIGEFNRSMETILGLDLMGGMQVLLEVPENITVSASQLSDARAILENRSNALGVSEVVFQSAGNNRIVGEFPGLTNTDEVISIIKQTGQLEFVDAGDTWLKEGTVVETDFGLTTDAATTSTAGVTTSENLLATPTPATEPVTVYHTLMTGDQLKTVTVSTNQIGRVVVDFSLEPEGAAIFSDYTTNNQGKYLAIVVDKKVISCPIVNAAITDGAGYIEGSFTYDTANALAIQLRYGSLPIPLNLVESRLIGPSLGQESLQKSLFAGIIGFIVIALFMIIFYRLPGAISVIAILIYGLITIAVYKLIPVTLTLPGIAGFLLSTGGALDSNILIFERLKEELRSGRNLANAVDLGWKRAWPSIRDSNAATLITSLVLFIFGAQYGASTVKGFAFTLAIGVVISLFGSLVVTRTLLSEVLRLVKTTNYSRWFGL